MADTNKINVVVKTSSGAKYDISTEKDITVEEFKKLLEQQSQIPADQQRLIYSGHVLRNEQKLADFDIKDGHTMHLVRSARVAPSQPGPSTASPSGPTSAQPTVPPTTGANTAQPNPFGNLFGSMNTGQAQPGAQPNPFANLMGGLGGMPGGNPMGGMQGMPPMDFNTIAQMMQNPFVQNMMQQVMSNPALLQQMLANNPFAQQMMNSNPMMRDMMSNPEVLRQLTDPATMQNLAQMQQALGQLQGFGQQPGGFGQQPGGFGGLNFGQPAQPSQPQTGTAPQQPGANPAVNPFAQLFGGMGVPQMPQQQAPQEPPEVRFAVQLRQLNDMGFTNYEANIAALQATMGNVQLAIERLLGNM